MAVWLLDVLGLQLVQQPLLGVFVEAGQLIDRHAVNVEVVQDHVLCLGAQQEGAEHAVGVHHGVFGVEDQE